MKKIGVEELKKIQLDMMINIDNYCRKNSINYYLAYGTLIGAVRHHGYIPWDDDIDIFMKREDYNRFIEGYIDENYEMICFEKNHDYYLPAGKVIDKRTVLKELITSKLEIGVYIDVFPLDEIPSAKVNNIIKKQKLYINMLNIKNIVVRKRNILKNIILIVGKIMLWPISRKRIINSIIINAQKFSNEKCDMIASLNLLVYGYGDVWEKDWYNETSELKFEKYNFLVPMEYDKVLKKTYGDYLKLPSEEKQIAHHSFDAWWK